MTQKEIIHALDLNKSYTISVIRKVAERMPSLKAKYYNGVLPPNTHFSLEETIEIYKELGANPLQIQFMKENFVEVKKEQKDVYTMNGTMKFLEQYKKDPNIKCCNTCKYLIGMTGRFKMPKPYCKVYEKLLMDFNAKVYEDWCSSYCKADLPKPRQWFKDCAPINLNIYGETNTINGIEKEKMYEAKKRSVPNTIVRVNQVGFDD